MFQRFIAFPNKSENLVLKTQSFYFRFVQNQISSLKSPLMKFEQLKTNS